MSDTYSLVLTRAQLLVVLKAVKAACEMWQLLSVPEPREIENLLDTLTEIEKD